MKGYCLRCRKFKEIKDLQKSKMKNGRNIFKGRCIDCGCKMIKLI